MNKGIYKIINTITDDFYIGSSVNLKQRKSRHFSDLRKERHHSIILQRAVRKYGIDNFLFEIIEYCDADQVLIREQYYLDLYKPVYNLSIIAGNCTGVKHTKASNEKKRRYAIDNKIIPPESTWRDKQLPVIMLHYSTLEVLAGFASATEACRAIGKNGTFVSTITNCCRNVRFSAYGYRWVFNLDDIDSLRPLEKIPSRDFERNNQETADATEFVARYCKKS